MFSEKYMVCYVVKLGLTFFNYHHVPDTLVICMFTEVRTRLGGHRKCLLFVSLLFVVLFTSLSVYLLTVTVEASSLDGTEHVKTERELKAAINNAALDTFVVIALDNDISLTEPLTISGNKNITLTSNKTTGFYKLSGTTNFENTGPLIILDDNGVLRLAGIIVTHARDFSGNGVVVNRGCTLIMVSGKISGNSDTYVYSTSGTLLGGCGGGVINYGNFTMFGGEISGNIVSRYGGGVYNTGTFVMLGGVIVGNIAWDRGGGVYNERGTFDREGGVILGNIDLGSVNK